VARGSRQLPYVWSPWWWVLTSVRTGSPVTSATAARYARVRRSVEQVSMLITPPPPAMKPVLLMYQLPSGWM
jgi:hypothetical protein